MTIDVKFKGLSKLQRDFDRMSKKSAGHAMRNGLNDMAFKGRELWQGEVRKKMTTRNQFTTRSILVEKARGTDPSRMEATLGSIAPYMETQELGGTVRGKSGGSKPLAMTRARIGQSRARLVAKLYTHARISLDHAATASIPDKRRRIAAQIRMSRAKGKKFVLLDLRRKGIFKLHGSKRKPKLTKLWDLSHDEVQIAALPTLSPPLKKINRLGPRIMQRAFLRQLRRDRLFGH